MVTMAGNDFDESDLIPGDLIFFVNQYFDGKSCSDETTIESKGEITDAKAATIDYEYIDHVAVYLGKSDNGDPLIGHSITKDYGHYHPEKVSGVCCTTLRALKGLIQPEELNPVTGEIYPEQHYHVRYLVYRYNNRGIAALSAEIIRQQATWNIPYDEKRLKIKLNREDLGWDPADFYREAKSLYESEGIFRAIKYASRYPYPFTRTRDDGVGVGLTCSMLAIIAYQTAELKLKNLVASIGDNEWSGDKYAHLTEGKIYPQAYLTYRNMLRENASLREEPGIKPSIDFWQGCTETSMINFQLDTFPIDSKTIGAAGIEYFIQSQITNAHDKGEISDWHLVGNLIAKTRCFSPNLKAQNKSQTRQGLILSMLQTRELIQTNRQVVSPTRSPSPHPRLSPEPMLNTTGGDIGKTTTPHTTKWITYKRNQQIRDAMSQYSPPTQSIFFGHAQQTAKDTQNDEKFLTSSISK